MIGKLWNLYKRKEPVKVSIIVTIYNVEKYLEKCLASLRPLVKNNFELILVDDGSTDNSLSIIKSFSKSVNHRNCKIITQTNQGVSSARNAGLRLMRGEYVMFIDGDDYIIPDRLIELCQKFDSTVDVVISRPLVEYQTLNILKEADDDYFSIPPYGIKSASEIDLFSIPAVAWSKIYKAEIFRRLDLKFPEGLYYEDNYWHWMFMKEIKLVLFTDVCFYNYVRRSGSIMSNTFAKKRGYSLQRILILRKILNDCKKLSNFERKKLINIFFNSALSDCSKMDYLELLYITQKTVRFVEDQDLLPCLLDLKYGNLEVSFDSQNI